MKPLPPMHGHTTLKSKVVALMTLPPYSEEEGRHGAITTYPLSFAVDLIMAFLLPFILDLLFIRLETRTEFGPPSAPLSEE